MLTLLSFPPLCPFLVLLPLAVGRARTAMLCACARPVQSYKEQASRLAGQIAFLKMYSTRCAQDTARDAVQIFGGRGITQTGMGRFIEHVRSPLLSTELCSSVR